MDESNEDYGYDDVYALFMAKPRDNMQYTSSSSRLMAATAAADDGDAPSEPAIKMSHIKPYVVAAHQNHPASLNSNEIPPCPTEIATIREIYSIHCL